MTDDPLFERRPANLLEAEAVVAEIGGRLTERNLAHRPAPPVPTACCGRGCNGCVWEGYYEALLRWQHDAGRLLAERNAPF